MCVSDRIMCPDVPIALRMSGHLLLGVVRIYSKKVDYLYHDCNVFLISLRKTFSTVSVNLPEDATHAPAHTVTLPQKFNLDSVDLDDHTFDDEYDNHLRSQEDITLTGLFFILVFVCIFLLVCFHLRWHTCIAYHAYVFRSNSCWQRCLCCHNV